MGMGRGMQMQMQMGRLLGVGRRDMHALSSWLPPELVPMVLAACANAWGLVLHMVREDTSLALAQFGPRGLTAQNIWDPGPG